MGLAEHVMQMASSVNVVSSIQISKHYSDYKHMKQLTKQTKKQFKTRRQDF